MNFSSIRQTRAELLTATILFSSLVAVSFAERKPASPQTPSRVTFSHDIAAIVFRSCAPCHHAGEAGPFPLLTYGDVKSHARQIADVTSKRLMPPWLPSQDGLRLEDDSHLSGDEIAQFQKWVADGTPEGNRDEVPPAPKFASGWQLGTPDLVLKASAPFEVPASGSDVYWNFIFRSPLNSSRFVKAIEIHPGEKRLVHHANLLVDRSQSARREEKSPGSGFPGMELQIESESFDPDGHFLFWKPGSPPIVEPPGLALRLDPGNDLVLNTHLQPSGKTESIQPSIGIYFTNERATKFPVLLQLDNDRALDIPAGSSNFLVTDQFTLPENVQLLAIYPHALRLALPESLPRGATIVMRYRYDNSSDNISNPNNPPQRVRAGNRAVDEMAHLWLQVLPAASAGDARDPRMTLQEALARHHIENNPGDFAAHYNLAAMLQLRGATQEAVEQYQQALAVRPADATVENALGGALLASHQIPEAIAHLTAAVNDRPEYFDARYNLGIAQAMVGNFPAAVQELMAAVKLKPDDAGAEANLGAAYGELGDTQKAMMHLNRALQLDPGNALAKENLEALRETSAQP